MPALSPRRPADASCAPRRLFFALTLPPALRRQWVAWRAARFPAETGRPVAQANLHLTLVFLGNVGAAQEQVLRAAAGRLRQPAFDLRLDDCGHWPGAGVVWLDCRRAPRELLQLAAWLRDRATRNGCSQNLLPFHPHISLWRQATQPVALPPDTPGWTTHVSRFGLWLSAFDNGRVRYRLVQDWPLRRDGPQ